MAANKREVTRSSSVRSGSAQMSAKVSAMGRQVYVDAARVKKANEALG
jgi:hypothetical protein